MLTYILNNLVKILHLLIFDAKNILSKYDIVNTFSSVTLEFSHSKDSKNSLSSSVIILYGHLGNHAINSIIEKIKPWIKEFTDKRNFSKMLDKDYIIIKEIVI